MWKLLTIIIHICVSPSGKPEIRDVNVFCHSDMPGIALLGTKIPWSNEEVAFHISWKCSLIIRWRINCGAETPTPCVLLYFKSEYWACSGPMSYNNRNYILIVFNETKWYKNSLFHAQANAGLHIFFQLIWSFNLSLIRHLRMKVKMRIETKAKHF